MKRSLSRLPVSRSRASSTSRSSSSTQPNTPSLRRSKSLLSLRRTPQSVQLSRTKNRSKKKDSRPIQDKKWQATALERTQHYFQQCEEGRQYLNKGISIRPITLKMFVQLTNVVLKNIDFNFEELTLSNYTELLPIHLDSLMYPGVVTASTLKTANTMHSWPHILAILVWLVDLHELSMMVNVEEVILDIQPNAPVEVQSKKSQLKIILDFFQQFNNGKETDEKQDEIIIENMYKKIYNYPEEDIENFIKIINKLCEEVQDLEEICTKDQETASALENECTNAADKLKRLHQSIEAENVRGKNMIAKKKELKCQNENLKRDILKIENSIDKLKEKIKCQPMNLIQRTNEQKEIIDIKREIALAKENKNHLLNLRDEGDMKLSELKQKLEQLVHNYNIELMRPKLEHPELNEITLRQDKLLQPNIKEILKENTAMKQTLLNDLEMKIQAEHEALSSLKLAGENIQQKIKTLEQKKQDETTKQELLVKKSESILENQKQVEKQKEEETNKLKQTLLILKQPNSNVERILKEIQEAKSTSDKLKTKLYSKNLEMEKFFEKIEEEIRVNQVPRYDKIRITIIEKVDKAVEKYNSRP